LEGIDVHDVDSFQQIDEPALTWTDTFVERS